MYCIQCGIELSPGQKMCPLCGTRVYHPDLPQIEGQETYPQTPFKPEAAGRRGILFVITVLCLLPLCLPLVFELFINHGILWSGYVAGAILLVYICLIFPFWFRKANPVIFLACDMAAAIAYLLYIDTEIGGGWFLTFAMPTALSLGAILLTVVALHYYVRRGYLFIYGGGTIALGVWTMMLEFLIHTIFRISTPVYWSLFSCASLLVLGLLMITIELVKPLKESLYRMFFIGSTR